MATFVQLTSADKMAASSQQLTAMILMFARMIYAQAVFVKITQYPVMTITSVQLINAL
jgi:hypothetical protein